MRRSAIRARYWVHNWSSIVCTGFLLMLCATGLPLIFHDEIDALMGLPAGVALARAEPRGSAPPRAAESRTFFAPAKSALPLSAQSRHSRKANGSFAPHYWSFKGYSPPHQKRTNPASSLRLRRAGRPSAARRHRADRPQGGVRYERLRRTFHPKTILFFVAFASQFIDPAGWSGRANGGC